MIGSDGNTTVRKFILNLTKRINSCPESEKKKIMLRIREIYYEIKYASPILVPDSFAGDLVSYHFKHKSVQRILKCSNRKLSACSIGKR